jgi:MFS transporter, Spinster family, sphingosine-1-phosphate transporter
MSGQSKHAKRALILLLAINLFNYIDRQVLAAVELPISKEFDLTEERAGFLASVFLYAYMVGAPILGRLAERSSRWHLIGISVAIWSLASGWTGLAISYGILLCSRILVGVGEAGYGPSAPALISDYFPIEKRGKVMSLFYLAIPVGSALGYVLGGMVNQAYGWRAAFWMSVPPGLILAALCFFMRDPRLDMPKVESQKRSLIEDAKKLFRIPSYVLNTLAMTAMTFAIGGISFWIPKYFTQRLAIQNGVDMKTMPDAVDGILGSVNTTFGMIVVIAGIISTFLGGWFGDLLRPRFRGSYMLVSGAAILLAFPCTLAMLWLPFPYAWYAVFGAVFFLFFNTGPANTALANVTSPAMRATAFAVNIFIIHALGDAISPPLIGMVKRESNWETAFVLVSLMMVIASVLWFIAARYLPKDESNAESQDTITN